MPILETRNLVYSFSPDEIVLKGINIHVEEGSIYGFLGPNGAGKTTTLRLILGLLKRQEGSIAIFGRDLSRHRLEILGDIGSLIESPSIYGHLTAVENLRLLQKIHQCPKSRITEVFELVGLAHTGSKRASQFSLGMKQRLSIAIALLHSPRLLVLDEPTNGLDPNGMIEIRELLRTLNREHGITIVISSHLLAEIDRLVSHVGIIHRGEMLFEGTLEELKDRQQESTGVLIETSDEVATQNLLAQKMIAATAINGKFTLPALSKDTVADLARDLVAAGIDVYEITVVRNDLERIFMDMVSD